VVVGCVGGGALIVALAAYYLYLVKPAPTAKPAPMARDVEDAPIDAPAASLGYTALTPDPC
jgi:hypothetical protein